MFYSESDEKACTVIGNGKQLRQSTILGDSLGAAKRSQNMSIAVLIAVHDGVVLAADSASTLTITGPPGTTPAGMVAANVYDNANKIFNLVKGLPIGCITFGSGNIGNASIGTLIKDLRKKLTAGELGFKPEKYTMKDVASILADFLNDECHKLDPAARAAIGTGFLIGGYSSGGDLGESWSIEIKQGVAQAPNKLREPKDAGVSWGGQGEVLQRIMLGFSPQIFDVLAKVSKPPGNAQIIAQQLAPVLQASMQAPMVFAPMPIQDAIDLARFLVHAASMFSRFIPGPNVVGGPIEIAAITKHEHFKWISRKHYYDQSFNKEPIHVICD